MDLYATYTEAEINDAADSKLQIVNDYLTGINLHLSNIKRRILIDDNTFVILPFNNASSTTLFATFFVCKNSNKDLEWVASRITFK